MSSLGSSMTATLAQREQFHEHYRRGRDPICDERLLWRAQTFRHLIHLLPGQSILELGCGDGRFTRQLLTVSRGENPITAVTFDANGKRPATLSEKVEFVATSTFPAELAGRSFDLVVAMDLLDRRNCEEYLKAVYGLLSPDGQVVFYESNPWNAVLKLHRWQGRLFRRRDPRDLLSRPDLDRAISQSGFTLVCSVFNDFVYRPLTPPLAWLLRNLSILLENAPGIQALAGSILIHARKGNRASARMNGSLFEHEGLRRSVSVVIPCHNEERNIRPLVDGLRNLFGDYLHEIIPVEDGSKDSTPEVIRALAAEDPIVKPVFREPPNGVGRALTDGYRAATGRWVLSMDCDFQHLLPEVRDLFDAAAEGYDVVVGSRFSRHSVLLNYPFNKIVANRGFHLLAQMLLLRRFRDLTNNLKLMRREVVDRLLLTQTGFALNAETGLQPLWMGCSVREVPISWINRTADMGSSSFDLGKAGGGYGRVLFRLWRRSVFGTGAYRSLERIGRHRHTRREPLPTRQRAAS